MLLLPCPANDKRSYVRLIVYGARVDIGLGFLSRGRRLIFPSLPKGFHRPSVIFVDFERAVFAVDLSPNEIRKISRSRLLVLWRGLAANDINWWILRRFRIVISFVVGRNVRGFSRQSPGTLNGSNPVRHAKRVGHSVFT